MKNEELRKWATWIVAFGMRFALIIYGGKQKFMRISLTTQSTYSSPSRGSCQALTHICIQWIWWKFVYTRLDWEGGFNVKKIAITCGENRPLRQASCISCFAALWTDSYPLPRLPPLPRGSGKRVLRFQPHTHKFLFIITNYRREAQLKMPYAVSTILHS